MAKFNYLTPSNLIPIPRVDPAFLVAEEAPTGAEDFQVSVQLNECVPNKSWRGVRLIVTGGHLNGESVIVFQGESLPRYRLPALHHWRFLVPAIAFDEGDCREDGFRSEYYLRHADVDPVIYHFCCALLVAVEDQQAQRYFINNIMTAMCAYIATNYGCEEVYGDPVRFGLAGWQEKRAREILFSHLADNISLETLASACSLSRSHFARSFKKSTGMTPHQCQVHMRVDRSRHLLEHTDKSIAQIGLECGFSDQSHFTRVFFRQVGSTPSAWRRYRKSSPTIGT
ncbi:MAG: transcriptional regulator, AraC family [Pseudomonas sp.]|nr:transcriptional regulator, AraC family [Pseudomonas sp.]